MRRFLAVLVGFAGATGLMAEPDWRFAHPQSDMLAGISTAALLDSAWADAVGPHFRAHGLPDPVKMAEALDEVDAIYFSSAKQSGLVLLTGRFDGGRTMQFLQQEAGLDARFINRATILIGEEGDMAIAAERLKDESLWKAVRNGDFPNPLFQRARELSRDADCWMIGLMQPALAERLPALFRDVRSYTYALTLDQRSALQVTLNMRSREAADKLGSLEPEFAAQGMRIKARGTTVEAHLDTDEASLEKALPLLTAAWHKHSADEPRQLQAQAKPSLPVAAPAPPPPPARRTVVIYGMDAGVKEHSVQ